ncbi:MAG TPA: hypothetical protein DCM64_11615 [Gammaproteobacteria bacterium]|jgi:hypothetical protein|nr:hypothetical protein [Gammaproteobacteria bacterium]MDP6733659.1 hypothetical protein [Gammaproteobacteria bacterium]HAJ77087.1 hypothetical protein [Gammaproteobacteria bacterium]|tara:strand:+ start:99 stop:413 length:315 start_codon:yes stop_codon:yes gene_type:complete
MNIDGSYQIQKMLRKMYGGAKELLKGDDVFVPLPLTDSFVERHTRFFTAQQMFNESGFVIRNAKEFKAVPADEWNSFIARSSGYDSWNEMLHAAIAEYSKQVTS